MSITDELREWAGQHKGWHLFDMQLTAIADRIDAEYEEAITSVMNDALYHTNEKDMAELGWVQLPKDADGETWHIGDRTESGQTIEAMGLNKHGWHFVGTVNEIDPAIHRHYYAPTVEDVLAKFALACEDAGNAGPEVARIIAEYAAKLRLAEEEDA